MSNRVCLHEGGPRERINNGARGTLSTWNALAMTMGEAINLLAMQASELEVQNLSKKGS